MTVMGMVKSAVDDVVNVITMGNRFVTAAGSVNVIAAIVDFTASVRIFRTEFYGAAMHVIAMDYVKMAVMQVTNIVPHLDCSMSAAGPVVVVVILVCVSDTFAHKKPPLLKLLTCLCISKQYGRKQYQCKTVVVIILLSCMMACGMM